MADTFAPALPGDDPNPAGLAEVLLTISLTGTMLLRPRYAADGTTIEDFSLARLNPAAQRMLQLPERPAGSMLTLFPATKPEGAFAFYCDAFRAGHPARRQNFYQHDGLDGYYVLMAQRYEDVLVVSFTDSNDQSRSAVEQALRDSQARDQAARAAAETQQTTLQHVLEQVPVAIGILDGPRYIVTFANADMALLWGRPLTQVVGRPHFEALPDLAGQGFEEIFAQMYRTGQPYYLREQLVHIDRANTGQLIPGYFHIVYQALHDAQGSITGIIASATEVTDQVLARQQVQHLNDELEGRVTRRTAEAQAALREAQHQRAQLQEQQSLLRQILKQVPAAVATMTGPEHQFGYFNDQYLALSAGRAVLGHTVAEVFPEVVAQGFIELLDQVYATGEPFVGTDAPAQLLDQSTGQLQQRYVSFIYQPLHNGQGQLQGILAFILDTTEAVLARRQADTLQAAMLAVAQRQAQQRQELYQIFAQTPVAIVLLREPEHRIDYFNPAFETLFPPEEWTGGSIRSHTIAEVYPRLRMAGLVALLDRVYATGETQVVIEMPLAVLQPGSPRYVTFSYQAYREQDRIVGVAAFAYDVTEQVLARQAREVQQQLVATVFEQSPIAIFVLRGPTYILEIVNPLMEQMLGHSRATLLGRPYFEAMPELIEQGYADFMDRVWQTGEAVTVQEHPAQLSYHQADETAYFTFVYQPLRNEPRGPVTGIACVAVDVTAQVVARQQVQRLNEEMQAANEELNDTNARLTRTNTDLDTFVYSASHDLKSPITNIEGLLLALRQQLPPAALQTELVPRLLDMMGGAVARFQRTLGYLTDVSRLQQSFFEQPTEAVDLPALVEAVRLDILPELTAAGATLTVELTECPTVYFAAKNLRSILYNLLSNAVKYRAPDRPPLVQLRAYCTATDQVTLEVQDNGLGLTEAQQGELFRLFRRLHSHVPGSGVGLYMVKKMVDNVGGILSVQSQVDVGSTFTVQLPAPSRPPRP